MRIEPNTWKLQGVRQPASHAAGLQAWRRAVVSSQRNCLHTCRCSNHAAGLGSKLHHAATCLLLATLKHCAIIGDPVNLNEYTTNQTLRAGCVGFACYFQPLSNCTASLATGALSSRIQVNQLDILEPLALVANQTSLNSELLVMATLMAYLTRPQCGVIRVTVRVRLRIRGRCMVGDAARIPHAPTVRRERLEPCSPQP